MYSQGDTRYSGADSDSDHDILTNTHMRGGKRRHSDSSNSYADSPMSGADENATDVVRNPRKKRAVKPPALSLYVAKAEEAAARVVGSTADLGDATLLKIQKILSRADQAGANESEAKVALRRATDLMAKLNITRAEVLAHNPDGQKDFAGQSTLTIERRDGNTTLPVLLTSWASRLCFAMTRFFSIKSYTTKIYMKHQKKTAYVRVTFYGIAENSATAASAYEMVFNLLGHWALAYKGISSRNSYCLGVCYALEDLAESERKEEEKAAALAEETEMARRVEQEKVDRQAELDRLKTLDAESYSADTETAFTMPGNGGGSSVTAGVHPGAAQSGVSRAAKESMDAQATCEDADSDNESGCTFGRDDQDTERIYLSSDDGDVDSDASAGGFFNGRDNTSDEDDEEDDKDDEEDEEDTEEQVARHLFGTLLSPEPESPTSETETPAVQPGDVLTLDGGATSLSVDAEPEVDAESRWKSRTALVSFRKTAEKIADEYLKTNSVKTRRGRKYKMKKVDHAAFEKGREDAKKIDVRRKAIDE